VVMPRTTFTQTWTFQNTGTTTWAATYKGYTLNLTNDDTLGAVPLATNTIGGSWYVLAAPVSSGKSIAPGSQATFKMSFIAPETAGTYTDTFTLSSTTGNHFGPLVTASIVVPQSGSTNEYDRARVISYANNYAGYVCNDGYFWTNGSFDPYFGPGVAVPTATGIGDDCAHFVSSCIGQSGSVWGGGIQIPSRTAPCYGEPAASRIVNNCLLWPGYAVEVFSLTNVDDLDHVTLYLGNNLVASHAQSALDVCATTFFQGTSSLWKWHLIHILDLPTINSYTVGKNQILSWGTNWYGYALYSTTNLTTWAKVTKSPKAVGVLNMMTNATLSGTVFYRLMHP